MTHTRRLVPIGDSCCNSLADLACDGGVKRCAEEGWRGVRGVKVNATMPGLTPMTISMKGYVSYCYQYCWTQGQCVLAAETT